MVPTWATPAAPCVLRRDVRAPAVPAGACRRSAGENRVPPVPFGPHGREPTIDGRIPTKRGRKPAMGADVPSRRKRRVRSSTQAARSDRHRPESTPARRAHSHPRRRGRCTPARRASTPDPARCRSSAPHLHPDVERCHSRAPRLHPDPARWHSRAPRLHPDPARWHSRATRLHPDPTRVAPPRAAPPPRRPEVAPRAPRLHPDPARGGTPRAPRLHPDPTRWHPRAPRLPPQPCEVAPPARRASTPTLRGGTPARRASTPTLRGGTPARRASTPPLRGGTPARRASTPTLREHPPPSSRSPRAVLGARLGGRAAVLRRGACGTLEQGRRPSAHHGSHHHRQRLPLRDEIRALTAPSDAAGLPGRPRLVGDHRAHVRRARAVSPPGHVRRGRGDPRRPAARAGHPDARRAAHGSLFRTRRLNEIFAQWVCACPVWGDVARYRKHHTRPPRPRRHAARSRSRSGRRLVPGHARLLAREAPCATRSG